MKQESTRNFWNGNSLKVALLELVSRELKTKGWCRCRRVSAYRLHHRVFGSCVSLRPRVPWHLLIYVLRDIKLAIYYTGFVRDGPSAQQRSFLRRCYGFNLQLLFCLYPASHVFSSCGPQPTPLFMINAFREISIRASNSVCFKHIFFIVNKIVHMWRVCVCNKRESNMLETRAIGRQKTQSFPVSVCISGRANLTTSDSPSLTIYMCFCFRFINARRRIVQPMIDQSNRAGEIYLFIYLFAKLIDWLILKTA